MTDARRIETLEEHGAFGGVVGTYKHFSIACQCDMTFSVFVPPQAAVEANADAGAEAGGRENPVPMLTYLAGLTCDHNTFMFKAGALKTAAELGLMIVAPDTSPRGEGIPDDPDKNWDFGLGAGFYVDATEAPWSRNYRMHSYVVEDLQAAILANFPADSHRRGIFGHSMGGHGALVIGLKHLEIFRSVSAFAPVSAPMDCPWGKKAFGNYLGDDARAWEEWDASHLIGQVKGAAIRAKILIDQGLSDEFLTEQLMPEKLQTAADRVDYHVEVRRHEGYDHGYYFISTFMDDHLRHHAAILGS